MNFHEYPQDTMTFTMVEETTLTNDTVRIEVPVNAMVQKDQTEDQLRIGIKDALRRFIDAEWTFGAITRQELQIGIERCSLIATTRVKERENHSLKDRARQASISGSIELGDPSPNYTMPNAKIQEGERELRKALFARVKEHATELSEAAGRSYRISSIVFGAQQRYEATSNRMAVAAYASNFAAEASGGGDGVDMSHSAKIIMTATITLAVAMLGEDRTAS